MALGKFSIELAEAHTKLGLIRAIHNAAYYNVASYYADAVGVELAYVVQAILNDERCELNPFGQLAKLLLAEFEPSDQLWRYVTIEPTVTCVNCEAEVLYCMAGFAIALGGWLGHSCCVHNDDDYYEEYSCVYT